jgi:hypothetical protein
MTPESMFAVANYSAIAGWIVLVGGILLNNTVLRDIVAGRVIPLIFAAGYTLLILSFWVGAEGGFGNLADVARLFSNRWLLLAGWVHYLAFDLLIAAWMARRTAEERLPRLALIAILPLTFLFGPAGFLAFETTRLIALRVRASAGAQLPRS